MMKRLYKLLAEINGEWSTEEYDLVCGLDDIAEEVGGYVEKIYDGFYVICYTDEEGKDREEQVNIEKVGSNTYVIEW